MVTLDSTRLSPYHQAIWNRHAPDAFQKFDKLGIDRKDICMAVENVNIERWMRDWEHMCDICGDIVPRRDYNICDTCDRYSTLHHFAGDIHFTIHDGPVGSSRVIFYLKDQGPKVRQRRQVPYNFH